MGWESELWPWSVTQLLFGRLGLVEVRQPAIGVVKLALLNGEHDERVPRTRILQIGLREVCVAVGMRMVDPDQIHITLAGGLVGSEQVFGAQLVAGGLRAFE